MQGQKLAQGKKSTLRLLAGCFLTGILFSAISPAQAFTISPEDSVVKLNAYGRFTLDKTSSTQSSQTLKAKTSTSAYPDYERYKQSYLMLVAHGTINQANLGVAGLFSVNKNFDKVELTGKLSRAYVFLQSKNLGSTQIGKTNSVISKFFLSAQNYNQQMTNFLPQTPDSENFWTWKYESSKNNYYNYGLSFSRKAKIQDGKYSHIAGYINWDFHPREQDTLTLSTLYASQKYYWDNNQRLNSNLLARTNATSASGNKDLEALFTAANFKPQTYTNAQSLNKQHLGAVGLSYDWRGIWFKSIKASLTYYKAHETAYSNLGTSKNQHQGYISSLVINPFAGLKFVGSYSQHQIKNTSKILSQSFNDQVLLPGEKATSTHVSYGINWDFADYYTVYFERSNTKVKYSLTKDEYKDNFSVVGLMVTF